MRTIKTKFLGPTNTRGSRIKATSDDVSATVSYRYDLSGMDAHAQAAIALCRKMGWSGDIVGHHAPIGSGYVFRFAVDSGTVYSTEENRGAE